MKVIAYIYTNEKNSRESEIQRQKLTIADFCGVKKYSIVDCRIEEPVQNSFEYPVLFNLLAEHEKYDKIIFCSQHIFYENPEFENWIFEELKARNIRFEFADNTISKHNVFDIEQKKQFLIDKANNVPSLPGIVVKTLQLIQNEKSSANQLSQIIKYDTGLTGKILKLVNSSFYGFSKQISSIQHGIAILGFNTIKGLVISSNIYKSFKNASLEDTFDYKKFWLHTTLCATLANDFASKIDCSAQEKEEIFSSAILHDIGKLILNKYDNSNYKNVLLNTKNELDTEQVVKLEEKYCTLSHTTVGQIVTEKWNLPEIISQTAAYHHSPLKADENYRKSIALISLTNTLSNVIINADEIKEENFNENILKFLNINYSVIANKFEIFKQHPNKIKELESFFNEEQYG